MSVHLFNLSCRRFESAWNGRHRVNECEDAMMVMELLPSLDDLVGLFESEPRYADATGGSTEGGLEGWRYPWPYTLMKFLAVRD
ncbi:hypothetical protein [Dactylosporangium matsuzakiense]|nr:hypothetical protein [Dactylosporangium matsuzakiense]UWZ44697.1 hypothetical protein Dmats_46480 [Dactylosporangium matsuzakiense]